MYTSLIIIHVIAMVASLGLMSTAIIAALFGKKAAVKVATVGVATSVLGFLSGTVLLLQAPVLSECVILTTYLAAVIVVYAFGFGWGDATKAVLLRSRL